MSGKIEKIRAKNQEKFESAGELMDFRQEIFDETTYSHDEVSFTTIKRFLKQGFSFEQIFALYYISCAYKSVKVGVGGHVKDSKIPIGIVLKFALQFIGDDFTLDQLEKDILSLTSLTRKSPKNFAKKHLLYCKCGDHLSCLVRRSVEIAEEYSIYSMEDFYNLQYEVHDQWWMGDLLEMPEAQTEEQKEQTA